MEFSSGYIYHIYNRGNNSRWIFFNRDNYLYFLSKIREFVLPYSNILAWCLMPTHFHLMVELLREKLPVSNPDNPDLLKERTFNNSIAIMLRSYTRAINLQEKRTGSLFQAHTKSICLNSMELSSAYFNTFSGSIVNVPISDYLIKCFNYIHENPLKHGKVAKIDDWEFSSWLDYYKSRGGTLINRERAVELELFEIQSYDD